MAGLLAAACARSLKKDQDLAPSPSDLSQKIEDLKMPAQAPVTPLAATPPAKKSNAKPEPKKKEKKLSPKEEAKVDWSPTRWPFGVGEKITFVVRYGVIEGGIGTLEVLEPKMIDGEPMLHYRGHVKSSKVLELFYKIDDELQTWVRLKDHVPRRQEITQFESPKWGRRVVIYEPEKHLSKFYSNTTYKDGRFDEIRQDVPMTHFAQDVLGAMYFYRMIDDFTHANFPIVDRFSNWNNEFTFMGKEQITVPAGTMDTLKFKMNPRVDGDLNTKGDVMVWFKDDPSHIIVQFKAKVKIGSITGELKSYEPGRPLTLPLPVMKTPIHLNSLGQMQK